MIIVMSTARSRTCEARKTATYATSCSPSATCGQSHDMKGHWYVVDFSPQEHEFEGPHPCKRHPKISCFPHIVPFLKRAQKWWGTPEDLFAGVPPKRRKRRGGKEKRQKGKMVLNPIRSLRWTALPKNKKRKENGATLCAEASQMNHRKKIRNNYDASWCQNERQRSSVRNTMRLWESHQVHLYLSSVAAIIKQRNSKRSTQGSCSPYSWAALWKSLGSFPRRPW